MRFFIDSKDKTVVCFKSNKEAAKAVIKKLNISAGSSVKDPVKTAFEALGDRGAIVNLSQAFECIEDSDNYAAQELAKQMKEAVNKFYEDEC